MNYYSVSYRVPTSAGAKSSTEVLSFRVRASGKRTAQLRALERLRSECGEGAFLRAALVSVVKS